MISIQIIEKTLEGKGTFFNKLLTRVEGLARIKVFVTQYNFESINHTCNEHKSLYQFCNF